MRQPRPEAEARSPSRALAPARGNFRHGIAREKSLHRDLKVHFEAALALKAQAAKHFFIVDFEGIGSVMNGNTSQPVQAQAGSARKQLFEPGAALLAAAFYVAAASHQLVASAI